MGFSVNFKLQTDQTLGLVPMFITYDADRYTDDQRRYAFWGTGYAKEFENSRFNPILTQTIGTKSPNCTDPTACNYNQPLTKEKPVCWYKEKHKDCVGRCISVHDCNGVCGGEMKEDACGVCGGSKTDKKDCPECAGGIVLDCAGKCGGTSTKDKCGICKDWDNDKDWKGKAGDECTGCKSKDACNAFTGHKFHDPKKCEFPTEHFNCKKECISKIDCESVCGGTARLNKCNMCNRPDTACPTQSTKGITTTPTTTTPTTRTRTTSTTTAPTTTLRIIVETVPTTTSTTTVSTTTTTTTPTTTTPTTTTPTTSDFQLGGRGRQPAVRSEEHTVDEASPVGPRGGRSPVGRGARRRVVAEGEATTSVVPSERRVGPSAGRGRQRRVVAEEGAGAGGVATTGRRVGPSRGRGVSRRRMVAEEGGDDSVVATGRRIGPSAGRARRRRVVDEERAGEDSSVATERRVGPSRRRRAAGATVGSL